MNRQEANQAFDWWNTLVGARGLRGYHQAGSMFVAWAGRSTGLVRAGISVGSASGGFIVAYVTLVLLVVRGGTRMVANISAGIIPDAAMLSIIGSLFPGQRSPFRSVRR